jgi:hypothetical protein
MKKGCVVWVEVLVIKQSRLARNSKNQKRSVFAFAPTTELTTGYLNNGAVLDLTEW